MSLVGQRFFTQFAIFDAGANPLGLVLSNAGTISIGE
jgi:hypothetical protein